MRILMLTVFGSLASVANCEDDFDEDENLREFVESINSNCTNYNCLSDTDYVDFIYFKYVQPRGIKWFIIFLHALAFVVGICGNFLVCLAVYRNHTMRTVTNYFIVNLTVGDLMVLIVCLPPTAIWDLTHTWFLGKIPCKTVISMQTVSVTVSVLTLTFISIDRWYAICYPLRVRSTTGRAKNAIIIIWLVAFLLGTPELIVMDLHPTSNKYFQDEVIFTQCLPTWSYESDVAFTITKLVLLYIGPLIFMSFAYCQIVRVLWRDDIPGHNLSTRMIPTKEQTNIGNPEGQLRSRRKAAKMLVAVVIMFAICCLPVHVLSILRIVTVLPNNKLFITISWLTHWLYYANSAINPLIYNFMSGKFRKEFKRTFCCSSTANSRNGIVYRRAETSNHLFSNRSTRSPHPTIMNNNNLLHQHSTEVIPMNLLSTSQNAMQQRNNDAK